jgi:multidrug resistance protein, MATE family
MKVNIRNLKVNRDCLKSLSLPLMKKITLNRQILRLAIPNIITNITVPLLSMADLAMLGHLGSEIYIGAIALGGMVFTFIYWAFAFLRMSTSGFTAQAYGRRDFKDASRVLFRGLLVSTAGAVLLISMQVVIALVAFSLTKGSVEVESLAREYVFIRIWDAPATLGLYVITGWFIGMQNARSPMLIAIVVNLLNIGLNFFFVYGLGMNTAGVALGTLIAQYVGLGLAIFLFFKYYGRFIHHFSVDVLVEWTSFLQFFRVNTDIFVRMLCVILVLSFFTIQSANSGDTVLAANTLLLQFMMLFSFFIDGFAYAGEALAGKMVGAQNLGQFRILVKRLFVWGGALCLLFSAGYFLGGRQLLGVLTSNRPVIEQALPYMAWAALVPIFSVGAFVWDGIYIGATASRAMRNTMLLATFGLYLPIYYLASPYLGNHGIWVALLLFLLGRGVFQTILAPRVIRKAFRV